MLKLKSRSKILIKQKRKQVKSVIVFALSLLYLAQSLFIYGQTSQTEITLSLQQHGADAHWLSAGKDGFGTALSNKSKVWFTLTGGVLSEVFYPTLDVANVQSLELIIVVDDEKGETESADTIHAVKVVEDCSRDFSSNGECVNVPILRQINTAKSGRYRITKTYITDPARDTLLINVKFDSLISGSYTLYVQFDPSINNSGMRDDAQLQDMSADLANGNQRVGALTAHDEDKAAALVLGKPPYLPTMFGEATVGYVGENDGLQQLQQRIQEMPKAARSARDKNRLSPIAQIKNGNIALTARIPYTYRGTAGEQAPGFRATSDYEFVLALGFGANEQTALKNARQSLFISFEARQQEYRASWREYFSALPNVGEKYQARFNMAAMVLWALEDKTFAGAGAASPSSPWGGGANANEAGVSGYHAVWARDLYQAATAFIALGDKAAANRALDYLFRVQQKPDGSFPQNTWIDGRAANGGLQMDEVAFPLILAYQLGRFDHAAWSKHVKPAADFIVAHGAATPQERWEEKGGYSPSTIAAEIAGLVCAAEIARRNGDIESQKKYLAVADEWERNIENWTATKTGKYGDGNYYLRTNNNTDSNDGARLAVNNRGTDYDEREIVDAGFLELVRLGIRRADDPLVVKSLKVVDKILKVETPHGAGWYRYNHDSYGEEDDGRKWNWDGKYSGKGRLWTLLTGERGEYELALAQESKVQSLKSNVKNRRDEFLRLAQARLDAMTAFANDGLMLPEQVWDKVEVQGSKFKVQSPQSAIRNPQSGSATPLAWSCAQYIRLALNIQAGRNLETPDIVYARYAARQTRQTIKNAPH